MNIQSIILALTFALFSFFAFGSADSKAIWTEDGFIDQPEAAKILPYAYLAADAYRIESKPVADFTIVPYEAIPAVLKQYYIGSKTNPKTGLSYNLEMLSDKNSGMQARLYKALDSNTYVLAFAGSEIDKTLRGYQNLKTNVTHAAGYEASAYSQAGEWLKAVIEAYPEAKIIATGTSLGGGFAQYAILMNRIQPNPQKAYAANNNLEAYCFNAPGLTGAQLSNIIKANGIPSKDSQKPSSAAIKLMNAIARTIITHVYVEGEWVSGYHPGYWFGKQYTVRFYDQSWGGYYSKSHHNAYAVRKSMEKAAEVVSTTTKTDSESTTELPTKIISSES